ncbi:MAG: tetratricopeptide repeat protein [Thermodesulfobacteriota bacterium]
MTTQSAFDKNGIEENALVEPSGILDHLNLPPTFVRFLRDNEKTIKIVAIVIAAVVVVTTLYGSYRQSRVEKAAANLAVALQAEGDEKAKLLQAVGADFSGTPGAIWAQVELAHGLRDVKKYPEAVAGYRQVRDKISDSDPLYNLLSYAIAGAEEAGGNSEQALSEYVLLQNVSGYAGMAYDGQARIHKAQGDKEKALAVYEQYLSSFTGNEQNSREKIVVEEKIGRLKASM